MAREIFDVPVWKVTVGHPFFGSLEVIIRAKTSTAAMVLALETALPDDPMVQEYVTKADTVIGVKPYKPARPIEASKLHDSHGGPDDPD